MSDPGCWNCVFWHKESAGSTTGICRRYPPRHNRDDPWLHPSRRKDLATQPHTCKTDFCGEWQEKHDG